MLLEAALTYASRGWYVVPDHGITEDGRCTCGDFACRVEGKHPRIDEGRREGSTDPAQIREWWERWPDSNIALVCGGRSGIIAFDVDKKSGGYDSLMRIERRMGSLPLTVTSKTGGGGIHILFSHPGKLEVRNRNGLWPGIDIRADGGRIVAPPSRHKSGNRYEWRETNHPDHMLLAAIPKWLLFKIQNQKGSGTPAARKIGAAFRV